MYKHFHVCVCVCVCGGGGGGGGGGDKHGLTLIPASINNYIRYIHFKVWGGIIYSYLTFNGATVEG